ncbi:paramyosin isoform X1 [Amborella trichopoda]|uniref:paramyosin isoform X1 n=1 Tax=Amborella trichopoda TaxID=13333 RepID=UPI0005D2F461|nr:paramyosin isoform X1 [Amborella trichopoda]|eukprot:XP_011624266.1 paramyosin isoform X1 [Amborella trichopoda]
MALLKGPVFVGLLVMLALGCAMYLRLWSVQSQISLEDPQLIRLQFERAHNEALDESAEWRMKYDEEAERSRNYMQEVVEMKEVLEKKREENESLKGLLDTLQKEKLKLVEQVGTLEEELKAEKLKCSKLSQKL